MPVPMTGIKSTSIVFSDETKEVEPCARLVESRLRRPPGLGHRLGHRPQGPAWRRSGLGLRLRSPTRSLSSPEARRGRSSPPWLRADAAACVARHRSPPRAGTPSFAARTTASAPTSRSTRAPRARSTCVASAARSTSTASSSAQASPRPHSPAPSPPPPPTPPPPPPPPPTPPVPPWPPPPRTPRTLAPLAPATTPRRHPAPPPRAAAPRRRVPAGRGARRPGARQGGDRELLHHVEAAGRRALHRAGVHAPVPSGRAAVHGGGAAARGRVYVGRAQLLGHPVGAGERQGHVGAANRRPGQLRGPPPLRPLALRAARDGPAGAQAWPDARGRAVVISVVADHAIYAFFSNQARARFSALLSADFLTAHRRR